MSLADIRHSPAVKALYSEIQEKRYIYNKITNTSVNPTEIFRAQGAIEALTAIMDMMDADETEEILDNEPDQLPR